MKNHRNIEIYQGKVMFFMKKIIMFASLIILLTVQFQGNAFASEVVGKNKIIAETATQSGILTFNQLEKEMAKDYSISISRAKKQILKKINQTTMNEAKYIIFTSPILVKSGYMPSLKFYCQISPNGLRGGIVKVIDVFMNKNYKGISKEFKGDVFNNLESAHRIYWYLNGDFYDNVNTRYRSGIERNIGKIASLHLKTSYESGHYTYCYKSGYIRVDY